VLDIELDFFLQGAAHELDSAARASTQHIRFGPTLAPQYLGIFHPTADSNDLSPAELD
jgi:hypothetical protein